MNAGAGVSLMTAGLAGAWLRDGPRRLLPVDSSSARRSASRAALSELKELPIPELPEIGPPGTRSCADSSALGPAWPSEPSGLNPKSCLNIPGLLKDCDYFRQLDSAYGGKYSPGNARVLDGL